MIGPPRICESDIVRYLASRFPETMTITDNDGRTALHYAATIKDNGHFYNMLLQLGANPKVLDKVSEPWKKSLAVTEKILLGCSKNIL